MFGGLDSIDWDTMQHAYGPASDVPDLLRDLVSDDPELREYALDGMSASVHHQGDVYECTVAVIPFLLEAAAVPALPGRGGVLQLLASIGGGGDADSEDDDGSTDDGALIQEAHRAVAAGCPLFFRLLDDPDPEVRRAVPGALLACPGNAREVAAALCGRPLAAETDAEARSAVIAAAGMLGRAGAAGQRVDADPALIGSWLAGIAADSGMDPGTRLAAVSELTSWAPAMLPPGITGTVTGLLRQAYAGPAPAARPAGFSTDTLTGHLRQMAQREAAGRSAPQAAVLVSRASAAFGDRVGDRVELLTWLLREEGWEPRYDALHAAGDLISGWRGRYAELVSLIGQQLADPNPRLARLAAEVLGHHLDAEAAPAADALAQSLLAAPREGPAHGGTGLPPWVVTSGQRWPAQVGPVLRALGDLADLRALPAVRWALERPDLPTDIGFVAGNLGAAAAELVPLLMRRLAGLPPDDRPGERRSGLVAALGWMGAAAAPAVPLLLAQGPGTPAFYALGQIGPAAAEAVPSLREWLQHGTPDTETAAAAALWHIAGDPGMVMPTLTRHLGSDSESTVWSAAEQLGELGPAAASAAPRLRQLLEAPAASSGDESQPSLWVQLKAAGALWRVTGDAEPVLPVLVAVWEQNPHTREDAAVYLAEMGPAAAAAADRMVAEELERPRRATLIGGGIGYSTRQVAADIALLRACNRALAAFRT